MCLNPIRVRNNRLDLNLSNDKQFVVVPCGHCKQCIQQKILSWKNRIYIEYYNSKTNGNSCFMVTLTYDEAYVPVHHDSGYMCLSKYDIQKFLKRFRKRTGWKFKYIITSEFGKLHSRPHYHGIFLFQGKNNKINPELFYHELKDAWQLGFVSIGKNQFDYREIDSIAAIGYVAKYICKDCLEGLKEFVSPEDYKNYFKNFIMASNGIGESYIGTSHIDILNGLIEVPTKNGFKPVPMPLYFIRKLYYDVQVTDKIDDFGNLEYDEKGHIKKRVLYKLNDLGILHKLSIMETIISSKASRINTFVKTNRDRLEKILIDSNADSWNVINDNLNKLNNYEFAKNFVIYQEVFQNRSVIEPFLLDNTTASLDDDFLRDYSSYYQSFLRRTVDIDFHDTILYNTLPCFQGFELISKYVLLIQNLIAYDNLINQITRYNVNQKFRYNKGEFKELILEDYPSFDEFNPFIKY